MVREIRASLFSRASTVTRWGPGATGRRGFSPHSAVVLMLEGSSLRSARRPSRVPRNRRLGRRVPPPGLWGSRAAACALVRVHLCAGVCSEAAAAQWDSTSGRALAAFQKGPGGGKNAPVASQLHRQRGKWVNASCWKITTLYVSYSLMWKCLNWFPCLMLGACKKSYMLKILTGETESYCRRAQLRILCIANHTVVVKIGI